MGERSLMAHLFILKPSFRFAVLIDSNSPCESFAPVCFHSNNLNDYGFFLLILAINPELLSAEPYFDDWQKQVHYMCFIYDFSPLPCSVSFQTVMLQENRVCDKAVMGVEEKKWRINVPGYYALPGDSCVWCNVRVRVILVFTCVTHPLIPSVKRIVSHIAVALGVKCSATRADDWLSHPR